MTRPLPKPGEHARVALPSPLGSDPDVDVHVTALVVGRPRELSTTVTYPGGGREVIRWRVVPIAMLTAERLPALVWVDAGRFVDEGERDLIRPDEGQREHAASASRMPQDGRADADERGSIRGGERAAGGDVGAPPGLNSKSGPKTQGSPERTRATPTAENLGRHDP